MGNLRALLTVAVMAFAAACGDGGSDKPVDAAIVNVDAAIDAPPDAYVPDAPSYDFTCLNNQPPANIAANVTVSGTAQTISGQALAPLADVAIAAKRVSNDSVLDTDTSAANGTFSLGPLASGGTAVDAYLDATITGHRRTLVYSPQPLVADQPDVPVIVISNQTFETLTLFASVNQSPSNGVVGLAVLDCANTPVSGAAISVKQNNAEVGEPFDISTFAPEGAGAFFVFNVPAGDTVVNATYGGMTFRAHTVKSIAGATTTTGVRPGY